MVGWVKCGRKRWRIVGVYVEKNEIEGTLRNLKKWIGNKDGSVKTIVGTLILEQGERERGGGITDGLEDNGNGEKDKFKRWKIKYRR